MPQEWCRSSNATGVLRLLGALKIGAPDRTSRCPEGNSSSIHDQTGFNREQWSRKEKTGRKEGILLEGTKEPKCQKGNKKNGQEMSSSKIYEKQIYLLLLCFLFLGGSSLLFSSYNLCFLKPMLRVELYPPPSPANSYVEVLTLSTSDCDHIWNKGHCKCNLLRRCHPGCHTNPICLLSL